MDLDSWTPVDKARRWAVLIAGYLACVMLVVFWLVLHWPWWLAPLGAVGVYFLAFYPLYALLRSLFSR